jgi:hypothetical protein
MPLQGNNDALQKIMYLGNNLEYYLMYHFFPLYYII